jgi:hypothetical protein
MASRRATPALMSDYPCPCCGYLVFGAPPGSFDICPICFWEDDVAQLRFVDLAGGANSPSLFEAQRNFQGFGSCERRLVPKVRAASTTDTKDPEWRTAKVSDVEPRIHGLDNGPTYPADPATLYYWRASFWRRPPET